MILFISKTDLPDFVKFSANIADNLINPDIRDAHEFDVLPLLSTSETAALLVYRALDAEQMAAYLALSSEDQALSPIHRPHLLYPAVRGLLCHETYRRFLFSHGVHITPNGAELVSDVGHTPISALQRTELKNDAEGKCAIYRSKLAAALRIYQGPSAFTSCHRTNQRRPGRGGAKFFSA